MVRYQKFEIEIRRVIDRNYLRWPERGEAGAERNLGCNREYQDLRGFSWRDAERVAKFESQLISRLEAVTNAEEEYEEIIDELYEDDEGLFGLDIGVAAVVVGLSAAGCIPCTSCNAGAYGGTHHEQYPLVAFFAKPTHIALLLQCAEETCVGLENDESGIIIVYAKDIRDMLAFATALAASKKQFRQAARTAADQRSETGPPPDPANQLKLSLD